MNEWIRNAPKNTENVLQTNIISNIIDLIYCCDEHKITGLIHQITQHLQCKRNKNIQPGQLELAYNENDTSTIDYIAKINSFKQKMYQDEVEMAAKNQKIDALENEMKNQENGRLKDKYAALQTEYNILLASNRQKIAEIEMFRHSWNQCNDQLSQEIFGKFMHLLKEVNHYVHNSKRIISKKDARIHEQNEFNHIKSEQIKVLESLNDLYQKAIKSKNTMLTNMAKEIEQNNQKEEVLLDNLAESDRRHTECVWLNDDLQDENDKLLAQIDDQIQIIENNDIQYRCNEKLSLCQNRQNVQLNGCITSLKKELREKWNSLRKRDKLIEQYQTEKDENMSLCVLQNKKMVQMELMSIIAEKNINKMSVELDTMKGELFEVCAMKAKNVLHVELLKNVIEKQQKSMEKNEDLAMENMTKMVRGIHAQKRTIEKLKQEKELLQDEIEFYKRESINLKGKHAEFISIEYQKNQLLEMQLKHHFEVDCSFNVKTVKSRSN